MQTRAEIISDCNGKMVKIGQQKPKDREKYNWLSFLGHSIYLHT